MRVGVSGLCGFLGSHVAEALIADGHEVVGFDNCSGGNFSNVPAGAKCFLMDLRDVAKMSMWFKAHEPEQVIHCAAYASEGYSHWCRRFLYDNNITGTANLVNNCVNYGVKRLAFTSSIAVYGHGGLNSASFVEYQKLYPVDPYGAAKLMSELDIEAAAMFGLQWSIYRPHNIFGTRQNMLDSTRNFVSICIRALLDGAPIPIYGDGSQTRQFTPVKLVADVIRQSVNREETWNRIYNVGYDTQLSIKQMADMIANAMGEEPKFDFMPARHEVKHAGCDHRAMKLDFTMKGYSLPAELMEMIEEAKAHPPQYFEEPPALEIQKDAPTWHKRST